MKQTLLLTILLAFCATAVAAEPEKGPTKIWNLTGPLPDAPKRTTDAFPLSDQQNADGWVKFEPMSDEFEGKELDRDKWVVGMDWWKGRQPALFSEKNVTMSDGKLNLTMRKEKLAPEAEKDGYRDFTSAAIHSKARTAYGYFEVKAKPMNSAGSSSFWFQKEDKPGRVTEIDVFEIGGKAKGFERKYNMNLHVFQAPQEKKHWSVGGVWVAPFRLADNYHVYGLKWDKDEIKYYFDGNVVRTVENTHWHQPLFLTFDSETMPDWFGMPKDEDLPSTFSIEYVRAWKMTSPHFQITTKNAEDCVTVTENKDEATIEIYSPGYGTTTIAPKGEGWPRSVVVRAYLRGLDSFTIANGKVTLQASVDEVDEDYVKALHLVEGNDEKIVKEVEKGSAYWTDIMILDADGKAAKNNRVKEGGYFEFALPAALLRDQSKAIKLKWVELYERG